jgi:hypothetical protein
VNVQVKLTADTAKWAGCGDYPVGRHRGSPEIAIMWRLYPHPRVWRNCTRRLHVCCGQSLSFIISDGIILENQQTRYVIIR